MTTVQFVTLAQSISDIDLTARGIKSVDADAIPTDVTTQCPLFAPRPDRFISDVRFSRVAFGTGGTEPMNLEYVMHWQYFHAPVGAGGSLFSVYGGMLSNLAYIIEQLADNDTLTGAVDVQLLNITEIALLPDAAGHEYHGVELSLAVTEFINQ